MKNILLIIAVASLPIFAHSEDIHVTQCDIAFRVHGNLFEKKYDVYKDAVKITQSKAAILNEKEGLRGFNRNHTFTLTFDSEHFASESGTFDSMSDLVEGSKFDSKRVVHTALVEKNNGNRLAEFITLDDAVEKSNFSARVTLLSATTKPGIMIYDLDCHNLLNP